jgi:hypothetical protein
MFSLLESIIGFAVIMLMLSLLIKSITSILKNHIDYYTKNFSREVERFVTGTLAEVDKRLSNKDIQFLEGMEWQRLGEEYLTKENMVWLMNKMSVSEKDLNIEGLKARLEVHKANIRYVFEKRTKNIALVLGLALCLFMNINAFSIWETLYNDQQVRTKFSSQEYVNSVIEEMNKENPNSKTSKAASTENDKNEERKDLEQQRQKLKDKFFHIRGEVNFGIGKIYSEKVGLIGFLYEFFGSLLTGILISIGAPYWHDILRVFTEMREMRKKKIP